MNEENSYIIIRDAENKLIAQLFRDRSLFTVRDGHLETREIILHRDGGTRKLVHISADDFARYQRAENAKREADMAHLYASQRYRWSGRPEMAPMMERQRSTQQRSRALVLETHRNPAQPIGRGTIHAEYSGDGAHGNPQFSIA